MEKTKISLSFVKNGEPFVIPNMTVLTQEKYMEELFERAEEIQGLTPFKKAVYQSRILVWKVLEDVDEHVSLTDIYNMHPSDYDLVEKEIDLVFSSGRELKEEDFQKARPKPKKKSQSKKD